MRTASVRWEFKNGKIKSDREQTYSLRSRGRLIQMRWNSLHKRTQHDCERSASFVSFESTEQKAKPTLTVIRYSTALSGLLKLARSAFITWSRSKPMSTIPAMAVWSASPLIKDELLLLSPPAPAPAPAGGLETGAEAGVGVEGVAGGWEVVVVVLDGPPGAGGAVVGAEAGAGVEGPAEAVAVEAAATGLAYESQVEEKFC
jgi:hypothetical protein